VHSLFPHLISHRHARVEDRLKRRLEGESD
jgi:hypothetical protein